MPEQPWSDLIDADNVAELHREGIVRYGGDPTPTQKEGCVDRSLGAAWNAELYAANEEAKMGLCFAGCLIFYLSKNHCFVDGNKRVGWMSAMYVLSSLGLTLDVGDEEAERFCLSILAGEVQRATDVTFWLADRLSVIREDG